MIDQLLTPTSWCCPTLSLSLLEDEVHVWRADLDVERSAQLRFSDVLSRDERERSQRYRVPRDREHFVAARAILRQILARYFNRHPAQFQFCYGPSGKPSLATGHGLDGFHFNLSHSHAIALYAFTQNREIGIDIEYLRAGFPGERIARRFFSSGELSALRGLPPEMRCEAFFNCWTRKEAFIKATGEGLSHPLDRFEVSLAPQAPAALLRIEDNPAEAARWSLEKLEPCAGYVAALAVKGNPWQLKLWQWS